MAADIINTVLDQLIVTLPGYLNAPYAAMTPEQQDAEPLYLRTCVKGPLQDDPTVRAFYLTVSPDITMMDQDTHYRMPIDSIRRGRLGINTGLPEMEIGGPYKYINFFIIEGWLPLYGSRESAHIGAGEAVRRIEQALAKMNNAQLFTALATSDGLETTNAGFPQVFGNDGSHYKLRGGDGTWYPMVSTRFHIFSAVDRDFYRP